MRTRLVECLNCGAERRISHQPSRPLKSDACGRCGYVGWAEAATLSETLRRMLRDRTVEQRRTPIASW
jgi:ribosomal protein S27AE